MVYPVIIPLVVAGSSQVTDISDELIAVATRLVGSVGAENVNRLIEFEDNLLVLHLQNMLIKH